MGNSTFLHVLTSPWVAETRNKGGECPEQPQRDSLDSVQDLRCCAHLERRGQGVQHPHGCGVTSVPGAGSMRNIQPCQGQTWALAHCKPLSDNPRDWSCASLGSGGCCGDAASTKGDSRGENSRKRQHLLHQGAQCRGCGGDPLYLNCKVVREADSQGLVQAWHSMAFFISHWHPKKQLDMFPPFVSQGRVFVFLLPPCASGP